MLIMQRAAGNAAVARLVSTVPPTSSWVGPPTVDNPAVQRLPEWMEQIGAVGPLDALDARDASIYAREAADASGLPGFSDGPQDAYRHAYWSCLMAMSIGAGQAEDVGDLHEDQATTHPNVTLMDKHNNAIGRMLAKQVTKREDAHAAVMGALRRGNLVVIPNWRARSEARRAGKPVPDAQAPIAASALPDDLETGIRPLPSGTLDVAKLHDEARQRREQEIIRLLHKPIKTGDTKGIQSRNDEILRLAKDSGSYWAGTYRDRFASPRSDDELVTVIHRRLSRRMAKKVLDTFTMTPANKKL